MRREHTVVAADDIGWLTEAQMIEVDRIMIEDLHIELIQMMENAGRNLAQLVIDLYEPRTVSVVCGSGGNGGGGLVAARHLANRGVGVTITLAKPVERFGQIPRHQFDIASKMHIAVADEPPPSDVVIDALVGYSLRGAPEGRLGELIGRAGSLGEHVVSLDAPSGLDVTDGSTPGPVVDADATLTLALPKVGLRSAPQVGELYVADISVPPDVYANIGAGPAPPFGQDSLLRINTRGHERTR